MQTLAELPDIGRRWSVALLGSNGMLARQVAGRKPANVTITGFDLPEFDLVDQGQVADTLTALRPDVIINCAAYTAVDACEEHEAVATEINGRALETVAATARELDALLVHLSTDYVFDGTKRAPYRESDPVNPLSAYGRSKLLGEQLIAASGCTRHLIVRTSWLYGPGGKNFVDTILRLAAERETLRVVADQYGCPTYAADLADALYALVDAVIKAERAGDDAPYGICHFSNSGECSWHGLAQAAVATARDARRRLRVKTIEPIPASEYPLPAPRPAYSVFAKERYRRVTGRPVPSWQDGLRRYLLEGG